VRSSLVGLCAWLCACSTHSHPSSNAARPQGEGEAGAAGADPGAELTGFGCPATLSAGTPTCGAAPRVNISGMPVEIGGAPIGAGVVVDSPLCPDAQPLTLTGSDGAWVFAVSASVPVYFRLHKCGYFPMLSPEVAVDVDISGANVFMVNSGLSSYLPHYSASTATVLVYLFNETPSCDRSGVAVSAPGHPEAIVSYPSSTAAATSAAGFAVLEGLVPGGFTQLIGEKPGCVVRWDQPYQTQRVPLEAGYVSLILATFDAAAPTDQ
jgi:hypothetical protein